MPTLIRNAASTGRTGRTAIGSKGFTLAEVLIALGLLSIFMAAVIGLFISIETSYANQNAAAGLQQVVRTGMDIMSHSIRMAGYDPLRSKMFGFQEDSAADLIHFRYDLDMDGSIDTNEDIAYLLEDNKLKLQSSGGNKISLIDNVSELSFSYLNQDGETVESIQDAKSVVISLVASAPAGRKQMITRSYSTRVICRNAGL
jgi:prepilin-type N-terminal cleavage/methylation domain-containing protein